MKLQTNTEEILEMPNMQLVYSMTCTKGNNKRFYKFYDKDKYIEVRDWRMNEGWTITEKQFYEII